MRHVLATLTVLAFILGAFALAHGDDGQPADGAGESAADPAAAAAKALENRIESLEMEVGYLRSREAALTAYILKNEERGAGLLKVVAGSRRAGFEANRIPADSRVILLRGLEAAATSIKSGLPAVSSEEKKALKELARFRAAHGLKD